MRYVLVMAEQVGPRVLTFDELYPLCEEDGTLVPGPMFQEHHPIAARELTDDEREAQERWERGERWET